MAVLAAAATSARAELVCYVDDDATAPGNGADWETAFTFLQDALAWASNPANGVTEIRVAGGAYAPDCSTAFPLGTGNRLASFHVINGVALRGGYAGLSAPPGQSPDDRDLQAYPTTLTGDLRADDVANFGNNSDNSYHVLTAVGVGPTAVLDGLVVTAGNADGSFPNDLGAGMRADGSSPKIVDCVFAGNAAGGAVGSGGAIYNTGGAPTLVRCAMTGNTAPREGGAISNTPTGTPTLLECTFVGNTTAGRGGAIRNAGADIFMNNCTFDGNVAVEGGGLYNAGNSTPFVTNCTFVNNVADSRGGGVFNTAGASPTVVNCTFQGNLAGSEGGGMRNISNADPMVVNCRFIQNHAEHGGGISNWAGSPTLIACTFRDNTAALGGALYNFSGSDAAVTSCTFGDNWALDADAGRGGAAHNDHSDPAFDGCTFIANVSDSGGAISNEVSSPIFSGCTFVSNWATDMGGGMYSRNGGGPGIENCSLTDNAAGVAGGALASVQFSLAVIGDSTACENQPNAIEGDWSDDGGNAITDSCDDTCPADLTGDGAVDIGDLLILLYQWGDCPGGCVADIDGDGTVGIFELLATISSWGPC